MWLTIDKKMIDLNGATIELIPENKVSNKDSIVKITLLNGQTSEIKTNRSEIVFSLIQKGLGEGKKSLEINEELVQEIYEATEHKNSTE